MVVAVLDLETAVPLGLGLGGSDGQNTVPVVELDLVGVDGIGQPQGAVERPGQPLAHAELAGLPGRF